MLYFALSLAAVVLFLLYQTHSTIADECADLEQGNLVGRAAGNLCRATPAFQTLGKLL